MSVLRLEALLADNWRYLHQVNLVQVSELSSKYLIIDFAACATELWRKFVYLLHQDCPNSGYLTLPLADYDLFYNFVRLFFVQLISIGIKLVVVMDCTKISNESMRHVKHKYWLNGYRNHNIRLRNTLLNLKEKKYIISEHVYIRPIFLKHVVFKAIKNLRIQTEQPYACDVGFYTAQLAIVYGANQLHGILTNDTDYLLFKHCPMTILFRFFDLTNDLFTLELLHLAATTPHVTPPELKRLLCFKADSLTLCRIVHLSSHNHDRLVDFTSVLGNHFTREFTNGFDFLKFCQLPKSAKGPFHSLANYINSFKSEQPIEKTEKIMQALKSMDSEMVRRFAQARQFYSLECDSYSLTAQLGEMEDGVIRYLIQPHRLQMLGTVALGLRLLTCWPSYVLEDLMESESIHLHLRPLIARISGLFFESPSKQQIYFYHFKRGLEELQFELLSPIHPGSADVDGSCYRLTIDKIPNTKHLTVFASIVAYYWKEREHGPDPLVSEYLHDSESKFRFAMLGFSLRLLNQFWQERLDESTRDRTSSPCSSVDEHTGEGIFFHSCPFFHSLVCTALYALSQTAGEREGDGVWGSHSRLTGDEMARLRRVVGHGFHPSAEQITYYTWFQVILSYVIEAAKCVGLNHLIVKSYPLLLSSTLYLALENLNNYTIWLQDLPLKRKIQQLRDQICLENYEFIQIIRAHSTKNKS